MVPISEPTDLQDRGRRTPIVHAERPDLFRGELTEVQQKVASMWKTVYGSEVVQGKEAVYFLA